MICLGNIKKNKLDLIAIFVLSATLPLFFYNLGQSSLVNWDEAWYAEIARNILKSGNFLNLFWNGKPYFDHPPAGFWLIAVTFKIFGINEFWARFPSAIAGISATAALYFLGKELFNRAVGFASALALVSSFWFLYRSRSGDLDAFLVLFFVLSLFLAIKASKNKAFLFPLSLSLAFLFLTKTLVPFTIIPPLIIIFWKVQGIKTRDLILPVLSFLVLVGGWLVAQVVNNPDFFSTYIRIGFPQAKVQAAYLDNIKLFKEYLHSGIGKWFWPGVASIFLGIFTRQKRFLILSAFFLTFSLPFAFSSKGHIWHLIPLHPMIILSLFGLSFVTIKKIFKQPKIAALVIILASIYFSFVQIRQGWYQFIDIPRYISDEAILSREAGKYPFNLAIDGADFTPTAIFYSGKDVIKVTRDGLPEFFDRPEPYLLITYQWRLDNAGISKDEYRIIKSDRDKILVQKL